MNRNKFSVIKINGFKGMALVVFLIGCFAAGFIIFPGWICQNVWNFTATYFSAMPEMQLIHGVILWAIIGLVFYALNSDVFSISIGTSSPRPINDEKLKTIIKQINEKNAMHLHQIAKDDIIDSNAQEDKIEQ